MIMVDSGVINSWDERMLWCFRVSAQNVPKYFVEKPEKSFVVEFFLFYQEENKPESLLRFADY